MFDRNAIKYIVFLKIIKFPKSTLKHTAKQLNESGWCVYHRLFSFNRISRDAITSFRMQIPNLPIGHN